MNFWIDHYTATLVTIVATVVDPNGTFLCRMSSTKVYTSRSCSLLDVHQGLVGSKKNSSNHKVPSGKNTTLETHPDSTEDTEDTRTKRHGSSSILDWTLPLELCCEVALDSSERQRITSYGVCHGVPWKNLKKKHSTSIFFQLPAKSQSQNYQTSIKIQLA